MSNIQHDNTWRCLLSAADDVCGMYGNEQTCSPGTCINAPGTDTGYTCSCGSTANAATWTYDNSPACYVGTTLSCQTLSVIVS